MTLQLDWATVEADAQVPPVDPARVMDNFNRVALAFPTQPQNVLGAVPTTTTPTAPVNGQDWYYPLSGVSTSPARASTGGAWHLKYNSTTLKWDFVGGPPLLAEVTTYQTTTSTSYTDLTTVGPDITLPLAGDYTITNGAEIAPNGSSVGTYMSYAVGATAAIDNDAAVGYATAVGAATVSFSVVKTTTKTGIAASTVIRAKYKAGAASGQFGKRFLSIIPVQIG